MIAVDIVLLPPPEVRRKAIELNRKVTEAGEKAIVLDEVSCLPHITLNMGCLKEEDVEKVDGILKEVAESFAPITLETVYEEKGAASMRLEKTRDIELLHEIVMIRLAPFLGHKAERDMLSREPDEELHEVTLEYIEKFSTRSSFENYAPHITLAAGEMDIEVPAIEFVAERLALCHLGDLCTCRKVLAEYKLNGTRK